MDLCVKVCKAEMAIEVYQMMSDWQRDMIKSSDSMPFDSNFTTDKELISRNESIQLGILIKAYG